MDDEYKKKIRSIQLSAGAARTDRVRNNQYRLEEHFEISDDGVDGVLRDQRKADEDLKRRMMEYPKGTFDFERNVYNADK